MDRNVVLGCIEGKQMVAKMCEACGGIHAYNADVA